MVCQLHYYFKDKSPLIYAYEMLLSSEEVKAGADYVPYSEAEVKELQEYDAEEHLEVWTLPVPSVPMFFDLLLGEPSEGAEGIEAETTTEEVPEVATDGALCSKLTLAEGTPTSEELVVVDPTLSESIAAKAMPPPETS